MIWAVTLWFCVGYCWRIEGVLYGPWVVALRGYGVWVGHGGGWLY